MSVAVRHSRTLANHLEGLAGFKFVKRGAPQDHIGAALSDCILQAGVRYDSVVGPRVNRIRALYPDATTTELFGNLLDRVGPEEVLQWRHSVKPARLLRLVHLLLDHQVHTCEELRSWIPANSSKLLSLHGIGPKTVDYLAGLVGVDVIAVDRHVVKMVTAAGIDCGSYREVHQIVSFAADLLGVERRTLDYSLWKYSSQSQLSFTFAE